MQSSPSSWRSALRAAFPHTVPIFAGFLVLGVTYGMLMQAIGYGPLWSGLFSAIAFGGSTQYAAVPLLAAGFDPLEVFLLSLTISARHLFYSVSMLKKYDDLGWKRWMLYYTLCDETFSVVSTVEPPEDMDPTLFYFAMSLLTWLYWIVFSMLGGLIGELITFDLTGIDFALTALFVVLFIYGWNQYLWPLLVTNQESMYTIVMGIQRMVNIPDAVPEWNLIMAVALLGMLPPLLVVLGMQKLFVRGLVETEK